tara:strand:- start:120 stop:422 length:303 start_codon:yes stop_codon:yes gene_type:complete
MTTNYTPEEITNIVISHEKRKVRQRDYARNKYNNDTEFKIKMNERSALWYINNKPKKKEYYEKNKSIIQSFRRYKYALKTDTVERYKNKYPEEYNSILHS